MEICQVSCKNQSRISASVSDDTSNPTCVSDDISGPIRLWHVSPIRLRHVSLTHPQTPINKSLPKAFQKGQGDPKESWRRPRFKSPETLLEPSLEASKNFKNFNFEYEEHSKRNYPNHLPISQRSLETSLKPPKTSTNNKLVNLYRFKPLKPRRTSTTNLRIQRIFEEESSKSSS